MRLLALAAATTVAFIPAPKPGPLGLEGVPIPQVPVLAKPQSLKANQTVDGIKCEPSEKVAFHIHAHLAIFVGGNQRQVPFGIGIGPPWRGQNFSAGPFVTQGKCFAWLHTHTADGIIHEEAPTKRSFTLGQFFDLWGQKLSATQAGPAHGKVTALVGGKVWSGDPRAIPLADHALIQLVVGTPLVAQQKVGFAKLPESERDTCADRARHAPWTRKEVLHFGDTLNSMPTRRQRITVTNDAELAGALERMHGYFPGKPVAALVHDLAIKGAVAVEEGEARREAAIERLIERSTSPDGFDREALLHAKEAWGSKP